MGVTHATPPSTDEAGAALRSPAVPARSGGGVGSAWQQLALNGGGSGTAVVRRKCDCASGAPCGCDTGKEPEVRRQAAVHSRPDDARMPDELRAIGIHAKLDMTTPDHPDEREADRQADAFISAQRVARTCSSCAAQEDTIKRTPEAGSEDSTSAGASTRTPPAGGSGGQPLAPPVRRSYERFFGADLAHVRVHDDGNAARAARSIGAQAFAHGSHLYFDSGRYSPHSGRGRRLLAHELTHTLQGSGGGLVRRRTEHCKEETPESPSPPNCQGQAAATAPATVTDPVVEGVRKNDLDAVIAGLTGRTIPELKAIRTAVHNENKVMLERWLNSPVQKASWQNAGATALSVVGALIPPLGGGLATQAAAQSLRGRGKQAAGTANRGISLLWPALPLLDRLAMYDEGYRELEQAQIEVICSMPMEGRREALCDTTRLSAVYSKMSGPEEFEARMLIKPDDRYEAVDRFVLRARGVVSDDEDPLFSAILQLTPAQRQRLWNERQKELKVLVLDDVFADLRLKRLKEMLEGGEVQALIARLQLATERRKDDPTGVQAAVDRAVELFKERRTLKAKLNAAALPPEERKKAEARVEELKDLDQLLQFNRGADGKLLPDSFMALLAEARGSEGFGGDTRRLAEFVDSKATETFAIEEARQRILLDAGNAEAMSATIKGLHAPPVPVPTDKEQGSREHQQHLADIKFRQKVLELQAVKDAIQGLKGSERRLVELAVQAGLYEEVVGQAAAAFNGARWGEFFQVVFRIARNETWRFKFENEASQHVGAASIYARASASGAVGDVMKEILKSPRDLPLAKILAYTGDVETIRAAFADIGEDQRTKLRLGYFLDRQPPTGGKTTDAQAEALKAYRELKAQIDASQTTLKVTSRSGIEAVLVAVLGSEPSAAELATDGGRYQAAAIMYEQQRARLALGRGAVEHFTETDETMEAAAREFEALWLRLRDDPQHRLTMIDYSTLVAMHQRFESRTQEFTDTGNMIGEMAGMVAATVAGIVIVAATGGAATPGVIALAAAAGAGSRVVTRQMFGGEYYKALSDEGARDALLGAVDAALAVVGGQLAARGAELMGLGGRALASNAARLAGEVTEQATQKLSTKVLASAVEGAIDGAFSGSISEAFGAMTDARTWRRGIANGLAQVGQAALVGGLAGLGGGALAGAAFTALGHGASWLRNAVAMRNLENTLTRAGAEGTLKAAREAAARGDLAAMNKLSQELEGHLTADQARALREQLYADFRNAAKHPPGTATPTKEQDALLASSAGKEDGAALTAAEKKAETDLVAASDPQPSRQPGFVDEVDLGNQHVWRREPEGTWCRFSKKTLCKTDIPSAKPISPEQRAKLQVLDAAKEAVAAAQETVAAVRQEYNLLWKLERGGSPLKIGELTPGERQLLKDIFGARDPNGLTLAEVKAARGNRAEELAQRTQVEIPNLVKAVEKARQETTEGVYKKLRGKSPSGDIRQQILERSGSTDEIGGKLLSEGERSVEHVVPLRDICEMKNFLLLNETNQLLVANESSNLKMMLRNANKNRSDVPFAEWVNGPNFYSKEQLQAMVQAEAALREKLQKRIDELYKLQKTGGS
jgi:hypothetical protein